MSERNVGQGVAVPEWNDADPYTMGAVLCDHDGIVRHGAMHHGTDYTCTGHAHFVSASAPMATPRPRSSAAALDAKGGEQHG